MNKKIKHAVAVSLAIIGLSSGFYTGFNFEGIEAYAKERDSVYLKTLSLNKSSFKFTQDVYYYTAVIDKDVNEIRVKAVPKNEDATVTIDGTQVDKDEDYKREVDVHYGNNIIKVEVENSDGDKKTYTINVIQGEGETDDIYLDSLKVDGKDIGFEKDKAEYKMTVKNSVDKVTIGAIPEDNNYEVTIDGGRATSDENYEQKIDLNVGQNPIAVSVENTKKRLKRDYMIYITRESAFEGQKADDDIYLQRLKISDGELNFNPYKNTYEINVKDNVEWTEIEANPEKSSYKVKIKDKIVEDEEKYKDSVKLKQGTNVINISVQDEENNKEKIYTLIVNRGKATQVVNDNTDKVQNTQEKNTTAEAPKCNQWVNLNGSWQYNDATGNPIKNIWFNDTNTGKTYYLNENGNMVTGWLPYNNCWYYLDQSGARQTGWQQIGGSWYHFTNEGKMQTGWFQDLDGKYYYLYSSGAMASNTSIGGYKLGSNGAWIK